MKKKIIAGNWKMHFGPQGAAAYLDEFLPMAQKSPTEMEWIFFPPYVSFHMVSAKLRNVKISWGSQNCHFEAKGAFTGEISVGMLKEVGAQYCLVGHSERRQLYNETDEACGKKVKALQEADIVPLLCVGETQSERDDRKTNEVLDRQLTTGLKNWKPGSRLILAYEPVWAIGTGRVATPDQANEAHGFVRQKLVQLFDETVSHGTHILYGGSVKPENAAELLKKPEIDGFLVGGASLEPKSFAKIGQIPLS